jgi:hypothetical protein
MDETALRQKVGQLLAEVHRLPASPQGAVASIRLANDPQASNVKREMAAIEDTLDRIRLAIKYLVFDLEATKRENRLLRQMLGD